MKNLLVLALTLLLTLTMSVSTFAEEAADAPYTVGVEDILSRVRAGEPLAEVRDDFGLTARELRSLIIQAA